ncbi:MAG: hypothetical protein E7517_07050 [Ruminococcaceae bacterium]|nr:hypothetical protein [Oscillospiraceae bacterium]
MSTQDFRVSLNEIMPLIIEQLRQGETVRLTVKGVSMQPFLKNGQDAIFMVSPENRVPQCGDLFMFERPGAGYAMHRVCAVHEGGMLDFIGDNQLIVEKNVSAACLVAYVPQVERKGKIIDCQKGFLRRYMTLRMRCRVKCPGFFRTFYRCKRAIVKVLVLPLRVLSRLFKKAKGTKDE